MELDFGLQTTLMVVLTIKLEAFLTRLKLEGLAFGQGSAGHRCR